MDLLNTGIQTTDSKLYLLAVDTRDRLEIQFVPASISINRDVRVASLDIIGRNTPRYQVVGGETTTSLELDFYADEDNRVSVTQKCNWLQSLGYMNGNRKPAQRVILVWGNLFKKEVWTVRKVNVSYQNFSKADAMMPQQAYVKIDLALDVDYNMTWADVNTDYTRGANDGANPFKLDAVSLPEEDDRWQDVTNDNSFEAIFRRALTNMRL